MIIDGANLGYFKQNAAGAGELADLRQVDWAVRQYEEEVRTRGVQIGALIDKFMSPRQRAERITGLWDLSYVAHALVT